MKKFALALTAVFVLATAWISCNLLLVSGALRGAFFYFIVKY